MKFTIDTEFNGFGGELLSMALVPFDTDYPSLYLRVREPLAQLEPWVEENVWPIMDRHHCETAVRAGPVKQWAGVIAAYLDAYCIGVPYIIADWPDDIRYFCQAVITGPGEMAPIARLQFDVVRVDPWEAGFSAPGAVRHNAWWDAVALRDHLKALSA
jgi:hypothetical protein